MNSYTSEPIPYYLDKEDVADLAFAIFDSNTPRRSGAMAEGNDYELLGDRLYIWNESDHGDYQDTLVGRDGHKARWYGWFAEGAPHAFNRALELAKHEANNNDKWLQDLVDKYS